jgi:hypothetical protein
VKRRAFAKRRDANEPTIVGALEAIGASVHRLDSPVDLLVGWRGENYLVEVKDGHKTPSQRPLTDDEKFFIATWRGTALVVRCTAEALCAIGAIPCPERLHLERVKSPANCMCGLQLDPPWFTRGRKRR